MSGEFSGVVGPHDVGQGGGVPVHGLGGGVADGAFVGTGVARCCEFVSSEGGAIGAGAAVRKADAMRQRRWRGGVVGVEHGYGHGNVNPHLAASTFSKSVLALVSKTLAKTTTSPIKPGHPRLKL